MLMVPIIGITLEYSLADPPCLVEIEGDPERLLGFTAAELLSSPSLFMSRIHAGDADTFQWLLAAGGPPSGTACLRLRHADGRICCVQADYRRMGNAALQLRLQDAKELREGTGLEDTSNTCRAILENTTAAMVFKDRNHVYTAVTAAFRGATYGLLGGRDVVGLTDYDFLPEADADVYYALEKQIVSVEPQVDEVREIVRMANGTWVEVRLYSVKSDPGEVVGLYGVAVNLTERIRAEEQVYEANQALPEAQKLAPIGSYILDIRRGAFATSASLDAMLKLDEGYPRDLAGWEALVHPPDRESLLEYFRGVIATPGRVFNREYRVNRPNDGELRWVHGIGRVDRDREGRPLVMRGTVHDMTVRKGTEAALSETKKRLELFIEHAPAALAMYDCEMRYLAVSSRWRQVYGITADILGRSHYDIVPDIPERWRQAHQRALAGESLSCAEDRFDRGDESVLWIRWEMMPWRLDDGSVGGIMLFIEDITERKRARERLELAAKVFADASEAIFVTDLHGNIMEVNDAFTRMTGYTRQEVLGQHSEILKSDRHGIDQYAELQTAVAATGRWRGEQWFRRKDGRVFEVNATITIVSDSDGKPAHYVGLFFDITTMREQERKLEQVTHYDELTGLPNRSLGQERLRHAIAAVSNSGASNSHPIVGLILFDLDDFKQINEIHGREIADALLVAVAARMKQVLREGDTLARMGGDEFLAVLPNLQSIETAAQVSERLLACMREPYTIGEHELQLSATAGATFYPQAEEVDADQMIRHAVQAMYEAKLAGKNRYHIFDTARESDLRGHYEEIDRIRQALKANEFVMHYQPKVDMASGSLAGTEALIRWQHPERGLLLPHLFLPAIENHDLAIEVGEWVIEVALRQIEAWASEGHRIPVSVNVSPRHLQQDDFVERLSALLQAHPSVEPGCLELEILETSTLQDVAHVSHIIEDCLGMGIQVAIDDFGTGYSSLSYLKRLPAPVLKIDQAFVRHMLEDPDDLAILQGVMGLAKAFRRTAVAEGVETIEQGVLLLKLGCRLAQGYGIARPMPAGEVLRWYSNWWPDPQWRRATVMSSQEWPILVAQVELRAWSLSLERYVNGVQPGPPEMDERRCRFGLWLEAEKSGPRSGSPALRQMDALHYRAHDTARKALDLKEVGRLEEALAQVSSANAFIEEVGARLSAFAHGSDTMLTAFETAINSAARATTHH